MGDVVQFMYGADGLDPAEMEGNEQPVDFTRLMQHVKVRTSRPGNCMVLVLLVINTLFPVNSLA